MINKVIWMPLLLSIITLVFAACNDADANQVPEETTVDSTSSAQSEAALPSPNIVWRQAAFTPTPSLAPAVQSATNTPLADAQAPTAVISPTPVEDPLKLLNGDHFWLRRPFAKSNGVRDYIETAYPYGTTALGFRPHHGADYPNLAGTFVRAVADGTVIYVGTDLDPNRQLFGPETNFYGNLIVLEHQFELADHPGVTITMYTLYGHLSEIYVEEGVTIEAFQEIGAVGQAGVAIGPHLHLEVRLGDDPYDYGATYNPSLWIPPWNGYGILAGRVMQRNGEFLADVEVEIISQDTGRTYRTFTYHYDEVNSDPWFQENFVMPDLPAGRYDVRVKYLGRIAYQSQVDVFDGRTAMINAIID
ncbi:MAG: peptidoglycan DD-metalloendopeptidase family protein [Chloroflexi bacterium]|nr:peptidoglycan DD-metalloendopeptidase family protein [Chloroflexota bacterium]